MFRSFSFGEKSSIFRFYFYVMLNTLAQDSVLKQMNLDLLTQDQLKTYYTNRWCIEKGIKSRDILNHPHIDDAILLINIRDEFWQFFNASNKGLWAALWNKVYHLQFRLHKTHFKKLEQLTNIGISRQQELEQKRQLIKANRNKTEKGVVHMTTNPTPAAESLIGF